MGENVPQCSLPGTFVKISPTDLQRCPPDIWHAGIPGKGGREGPQHPDSTSIIPYPLGESLNINRDIWQPCDGCGHDMNAGGLDGGEVSSVCFRDRHGWHFR